MDRKYKKYDPLKMAHNVRKVYYIPYPSIQPSKRGWYVIIKSSPMGYIESDGVMEDDVAYQDDEISPINGVIEIEKITSLGDTVVVGQQVDVTILLSANHVEEEQEDSGDSEDNNIISNEDNDDYDDE
ncbi:unnamed protein product [Lathyrus sativus]|nr:unnamed protein product [Lathyrus sativus]